MSCFFRRFRSAPCWAVILSLLFIVMLLWAAPAMAGSDDSADGHFLADRHISQGLDCSSCHFEKRPKTKATAEACLKCHGPYAKLAAKTARLELNPHDSHLGQIDCMQCHSGHQRPQNKCAMCHGSTIIMKTP